MPAVVIGVGSTPITVHAANPYQNPFSAIPDLQGEKIDQGVDYFGTGTINAIGNGTVDVVCNSATTYCGWPGDGKYHGSFISYKLSDGPAVNLEVYVAECIHLAHGLTHGSPLNSTTTMALGTLYSCSDPSYPCSPCGIETGWAVPGTEEAEAHPDPYDLPTGYGCNFNDLLKWLGAKPGTSVCDSATRSRSPVPSWWPTWPPGIQAPIVADNGTYTFVADHNHLRKYSDVTYGAGFLTGSDLSGLTGPTCPNYGATYACIGYDDLGANITALAINSSYLYIGLSTGRVIKTNMCGTGGKVCKFSDNMGTGAYPGYHYWIGEMDLPGSITALAVNSSYLYTSFGNRTVKTTLCGTGGNVCAINSGGTAGLSGYNYWVGYQDWSWPVIAQSANNSYVFTSLSGSGVNRVCKTNLGSSGGDVFWLYPTGQPENCTSGLSGYYYGYQDMSEPVVGLSVDQYFVWWSLGGSVPRLVQTNMCTSGSNVCSMDGYGASSLAGGSWQGRQDWCPGYTGDGVTSFSYYDHPVWRSQVTVAVSVGAGNWRIVRSSDNLGINTLETGDCTGTGPNSEYFWVGYQNFNF